MLWCRFLVSMFCCLYHALSSSSSPPSSMAAFRTKSANVTVVYDTCQKALHQVIETHSYLHYNLTEVDTLLAGLSKAIRAATVGHSGTSDMKLERQIYGTLARNPCIKTICEIGFNGGYSAVQWLFANPTADLIIFDLWKLFLHAGEAEAYIRNKLLHLHPDRMMIIKGTSLDTVRAFHRQHPKVVCDLISLDDGFTYDIAVQDIANMKFLANKHFNILLVDDTNCDASHCVDKAVQEHLRQGNIEMLEGFTIDWGKGISIIKYNFPSFERSVKTVYIGK